MEESGGKAGVRSTRTRNDLTIWMRNGSESCAASLSVSGTGIHRNASGTSTASAKATWSSSVGAVTATLTATLMLGGMWLCSSSWSDLVSRLRLGSCCLLGLASSQVRFAAVCLVLLLGRMNRCLFCVASDEGCRRACLLPNPWWAMVSAEATSLDQTNLDQRCFWRR